MRCSVTGDGLHPSLAFFSDSLKTELRLPHQPNFGFHEHNSPWDDLELETNSL
jgi:hypothetical protein